MSRGFLEFFLLFPYFLKKLLQNSQPERTSSVRAGEPLYRMVFRAKRDPESSPATGGIQATPTPRFRWDELCGDGGTSNFCKKPIIQGFPSENKVFFSKISHARLFMLSF